MWGSPAAALARFWLARRGWYALRWVLAHGCFRMLLSAGKAHRNTPHLWIAITSASGRTIVFQRATGIADRVPTDWPDAPPPSVPDVFSSVSFDPVLFYERVSRC